MSEGIKPNEIRTGNFFEYLIEEDTKTWEPTKLDWQDIKWCEEENDDFNQAHRPIPITEEWLLTFGFTFDNSKSFSEYFNKSFGNIKSYVIGISNVWFCSHFDWMCHKEEIISKRGWCVGRRSTNQRYDGWNYDYSAEVEYVHQLQNLFFAITGYELVLQSAREKV